MQKKNLPGQKDGEAVEVYAIRTWKSDAALRSEFLNDFNAYSAYCEAEAKGLIRLYSKRP